MLDIQVNIEGDKIIIEGLQRLTGQLPSALQAALDSSAIGIHREAHGLLSGPGAKGTSERVPGRKSLKWTPQSVPAGGYPVPVRTGNLRNHLNLLLHGQTKSDEYGSYSAGEFESIVYDSTPYANVIHEGRGTSKKYGPRRFITDALERFNQGDRIKKSIEEEIERLRR